MMNRIFFRAAVAAAAILVTKTAAFAADTELKTVCEFGKNTVTVELSAEDAASASFQILSKGVGFDDLTGGMADKEKILFVRQLPVTDGKAIFVVRYSADIPAGAYNCRYMTDKLDAPVDGEPLFLVSGTEYAAAAAALNGYAAAENITEFKSYISENYEKLGFDISIYSMLTHEDSFRQYMIYVKNNPLSADDSIGNIADYNTFMLIGALNETLLDNAHSALLKSGITGTGVYADYRSSCKTAEKQSYFTKKLCGRSITGIDGLEAALKTAFILESVYYADGFEDVKYALTSYGTVIGITDTAQDSVYRAMCGKDYEDGNALAQAYSALKENSRGDGITGGGAGGGGGGGTAVKSSNRVSGAVLPGGSGSGTAAVPIAASFDDIEGVEWAIEAIVALADKGIINGKSKGIFEPNSQITREEFIKILTLACGYSGKAKERNHFTDVNDGDWFADVVNSAYENNLTSGMGDGSFGVGQPISRQDMAVMIYNALRAKGKSAAAAAEPAFKDAEAVADYAKEAIRTLCGMGVMNGVSESTFDPAGNATRAQAAKIIYGVIDKLS